MTKNQDSNCIDPATESGNLNALLAFVVSAEWSEGSELVFAKNRSRAKTIALGTDTLCDYHWVDLRCRRAPEADKHAAKFSREGMLGYGKEAQKIMRDMGWFQLDSGREPCSECDLFEWDGLPESALDWTNDDEPVCKECSQRQHST